MHEWLDRLIPRGDWHAALVDVIATVGAILGAVLVFVIIRHLLLRGFKLLLSPLRQRAAREGESSTARLRTLEDIGRSAISSTLLFFVVVSILGELGINVAAVLAGAGVAGLAVGFGAQRLVRDVLTGFFLLLEDQFRIGEMVSVLGVPGAPSLTGEIEEMGLRITRLRDPSGRLVTIGNGDIAGVINHHRGPVSATVDLGIEPESDMARVREAVANLDLDSDLFADGVEVQGVAAEEATRRVVRFAAPAQPGKQPDAELALRLLVADRLRAAGIGIR